VLIKTIIRGVPNLLIKMQMLQVHVHLQEDQRRTRQQCSASANTGTGAGTGTSMEEDSSATTNKTPAPPTTPVIAPSKALLLLCNELRTVHSDYFIYALECCNSYCYDSNTGLLLETAAANVAATNADLNKITAVAPLAIVNTNTNTELKSAIDYFVSSWVGVGVKNSHELYIPLSIYRHKLFTEILSKHMHRIYELCLQDRNYLILLQVRTTVDKHTHNG
jgi:hypothetical protein